MIFYTPLHKIVSYLFLFLKQKNCYKQYIIAKDNAESYTITFWQRQLHLVKFCSIDR